MRREMKTCFDKNCFGFIEGNQSAVPCKRKPVLLILVSVSNTQIGNIIKVRYFCNECYQKYKYDLTAKPSKYYTIKILRAITLQELKKELEK